MKIFISWSGKLSQELGSALKEWIPDVLQAVQCYFTPEDIQKGERWSSEIAKELEESMFGIFCMTPENLNSGWMHFEAGAISKSKDVAQVWPILFGLRPTDITGPLQQFQITVFSQEDMYRLLQTINEKIGNQALSESRLKRLFLHWWPKLEENVNEAISKHLNSPEIPMRTERDLLEEVLNILRGIKKGSQPEQERYPRILIPKDCSAMFVRLIDYYICMIEKIIERNLNRQNIFSDLKKTMILLLEFIPYLQIPLQEKTNIVEQLSRLTFTEHGIYSKE